MLIVWLLIKHYLLLAWVVMPLIIAGWFILPFVLICLKPDSKELPKAFKWFDNADGDGIDGDASFQAKWQGWPLWFRRYIWLAWRNPINYFSYRVIGFNATIPYQIIKGKIKDISDYDRAGGMFVLVYQNGHYYFEVYFILPYRAFGRIFCVRSRIGWKFNTQTDKPRNYYEWCFSFNPFMPFRGKLDLKTNN